MRSNTDKRIAQKYKAPHVFIASGSINVRRQFVYALAQLCTVVLGLAAMTLPEPANLASTASIVAGVAIVVEEILLIINALLDNTDRERILAMIGGRRHND